MSEEEKKQEEVAQEGQEVSTVINGFDEFWLEKGRSMTNKTLDALEKRHQKYMSFLNYLSGGAFLGGIALASLLKTNNLLVYLLFVLPLLLVVISKFIIGFELTSPKYQKFDLRSPLQIQKVHNTFVDNRRKQLRRVEKSVHYSMVAILLCFPAGLWFYNQDSIKKEVKEFTIERFDNSTRIKVNAKEEQDYRISFYGMTKDTSESTGTDRKWVSELVNGKKGEVVTVHKYDEDLEIIPERLKIEYDEDDLKRIIEKSITN